MGCGGCGPGVGVGAEQFARNHPGAFERSPDRMNLHLFSSPGRDDIRYVLEASRPYLDGKADPRLAYLPAGSLAKLYQDSTEKAFRGLARVETINTELMVLAEMEGILRAAALVYIPGGNTYLLNHRLHLCKLLEALRRKVIAGLPVVAFTAGTVLCGPNILTTNDINIVPSPYFKGLGASPFNFNVHYPDDPLQQAAKDEWLAEYHVFHNNPVILMADGAYVKVEKSATTLVRGEAWVLRAGLEKEKLQPDQTISLNDAR
jgi:peptidase E